MTKREGTAPMTEPSMPFHLRHLHPVTLQERLVAWCDTEAHARTAAQAFAAEEDGVFCVFQWFTSPVPQLGITGRQWVMIAGHRRDDPQAKPPRRTRRKRAAHEKQP